jgi:hypothetical protein
MQLNLYFRSFFLHSIRNQNKHEKNVGKLKDGIQTAWFEEERRFEVGPVQRRILGETIMKKCKNWNDYGEETR